MFNFYATPKGSSLKTTFLAPNCIALLLRL